MEASWVSRTLCIGREWREKLLKWRLRSEISKGLIKSRGITHPTCRFTWLRDVAVQSLFQCYRRQGLVLSTRHNSLSHAESLMPSVIERSVYGFVSTPSGNLNFQTLFCLNLKQTEKNDSTCVFARVFMSELSQNSRITLSKCLLA